MYIIIPASDFERLADSVNEFIKMGYKLIGGPLTQDGSWFQAVFKEKEPEHTPIDPKPKQPWI